MEMFVICLYTLVFSIKHRVTNIAWGLNDITDFFVTFSEGITILNIFVEHLKFSEMEGWDQGRLVMCTMTLSTCLVESVGS